MVVVNVNQARRFFESAKARQEIKGRKAIIARELQQHEDKYVPVGGFTPVQSVSAAPSISPKPQYGIIDFLQGRPAKDYFKTQGISNIYEGALPIGGAGGAVRGTIKAASTGLKRLTINPFAGMTAKQFGAAFGKRVAGIGRWYYPFEFMRSRATGEKMDWVPDVGTVLSFAASAPASAAGLLFGGAEKGVAKITDLVTDTPVSIPQIGERFGFEMGDNVFNFPSGTAPDVGGVSASYAPTVSVGGGGGGMDLEMLALMLGIPLAALLGYKAGKKRKRKKYKGKRRKK